MVTEDATALAEALLRIFGAADALSVAHHYADNCKARGDIESANRWKAAGRIVVELLQKAEKPH